MKIALLLLIYCILIAACDADQTPDQINYRQKVTAACVKSCNDVGLAIKNAFTFGTGCTCEVKNNEVINGTK